MTQRLAHAFAILLTLPLLVAGCTMTTPSQIRTGDIQIEQGINTHTYDLSAMTDAQAHGLAREYGRIGRGPLSAVISYDAARHGSLAEAQRETGRVLEILRKGGIPKADVNYVPATNRALAGQAVFSYPSVSARAPDHCTRMPGYQGAEGLDSIQSYQISCESKDVISKMVARPEDLLGTDGRNSATARRAGAIVETYQDGEPNESFYDIKSASQVSQ